MVGTGSVVASADGSGVGLEGGVDGATVAGVSDGRRGAAVGVAITVTVGDGLRTALALGTGLGLGVATAFCGIAGCGVADAVPTRQCAGKTGCRGATMRSF